MRKLLALNRGEIAIRILRAANELGIRTVAVFSQEDRLSLHRFKADEAYLIGEGKGPVQAYLDVEGIVALAAGSSQVRLVVRDRVFVPRPPGRAHPRLRPTPGRCRERRAAAARPRGPRRAGPARDGPSPATPASAGVARLLACAR